MKYNYMFHNRKKFRYSNNASVMHLSAPAPATPPPRGPSEGGRVAGIPRGIDSQNKSCPQEFDRQLWHIGGTLDVSARKPRRNKTNVWRTIQEIFGTKLWHMGRELDPIFFKLFLFPGGTPALPALGENIDRCMSVSYTMHKLMSMI